ncbi:hypothetical protein AVEN_60514-1 [Araneus ventricosus]|uniref:Uncharacterized protein n=1 Tax=Araneus ventricosus TaxID=182803 RepID=A0A4Y2FQE4_ARAVE|nr:hypothetical protein AVEN_60514-1 [Araneus ventricosus]
MFLYEKKEPSFCHSLFCEYHSPHLVVEYMQIKLLSPHRSGSNHVYTPSSLVFKSTAPVRAMLVSFYCTQSIPFSTCWWGVSLPAGPRPGFAPLLGRPGQCGYFCATPAGGHLAPTYDWRVTGPMQDGSSLELGFEPGAQ